MPTSHRPHRGTPRSTTGLTAPDGAAGAARPAKGDHYRLMFERTPTPMWAFEEGTLRFLMVNDAAVEQYGFSRDEFLAMTLRDIRPPEDIAPLEELRALAPPAQSRFVARHRTKDGRTIDVEVCAQSMEIDGRRAGLVLVHDITDKMRAERALQQAHATLATLVSASPLAIVTTDLSGVVQSWNPAAESIFGWTAAEVIGRPIPFVPPTSADEVVQRRRALAGGDGVRTIETRRLRKDGTIVDVLLATAALRDATGQASGVVGFLADITERKLLAEQLRQSQKMEAVGRLAGGVAHDFNNLLTVIKCHGDFLRADLDHDDPRRQDVEQIAGAAERAAGLTRQLLTFSRKQILQPRVLDLGEVVAGIEPLLRRLIGEDIELATVAAASDMRISADPGQLEQVLVNLAVNARDAMPDGGSLVIETSVVTVRDADQEPGVPRGAYVVVTVADSGVGMDDETRARMFEPFFTTKPAGRGTGLGLSTVYAVVQQAAGHIRVRSERGRGTSFRLFFPQVGEAPAPDPIGAAESAPAGGSETVLVAEDEEGVRALTCRILRRQGYTVLEARHGADALHLAIEYPGRIDVLLTDVVMPEMSGRALAERLTAMRPDLRVAFMSGYTDDDIVRRGLLESGVLLLQKPFTARQLTGVVRRVLDGGGEP